LYMIPAENLYMIAGSENLYMIAALLR